MIRFESSSNSISSPSCSSCASCYRSRFTKFHSRPGRNRTGINPLSFYPESVGTALIVRHSALRGSALFRGGKVFQINKLRRKRRSAGLRGFRHSTHRHRVTGEVVDFACYADGRQSLVTRIDCSSSLSTSRERQKLSGEKRVQKAPPLTAQGGKTAPGMQMPASRAASIICTKHLSYATEQA
jgi:hypothetical protein